MSCQIPILGVLILFSLYTSAFGDIITVPGDQPTIQAAIGTAIDGDEIIVALGTYFESITFLGKAITLRSTDPSDPAVVAATIIDATGLGQVSVVLCNTSEGPDTILDGFTITGGTGAHFDGIPTGGGMHNSHSSPTVTNCSFSGNAAYWGGAMFNLSSNVTVTNCTFTGNAATSGAGMYNTGGSPTVTNCTFSANTAAYGGGGMVNGGGSPTVTNCTFSRNIATLYSGGGMSNGLTNLMVIGCIFDGNSANTSGGGMSNGASNDLTVVNSTFRGNTADNGRALSFNSVQQNWPSDLSMTNCILWDGGGEVWNNDNSVINIAYSDVQGGRPGKGNIDADPLFVDPGYWDDNGTPKIPDDDFWVEGDYHILPGSPCIDAGDNTAVPDGIITDLDGNPRFVDDPDTPDTGNPDGIHPIVDMGAYEFGPPDLCADADGDGRVTICHSPPGNPDNARTITVGVNAVPVHLAHGDHCGPCEGDGGLLMSGTSAAERRSVLKRSGRLWRRRRC